MGISNFINTKVTKFIKYQPHEGTGLGGGRGGGKITHYL